MASSSENHNHANANCCPSTRPDDPFVALAPTTTRGTHPDRPVDGAGGPSSTSERTSRPLVASSPADRAVGRARRDEELRRDQSPVPGRAPTAIPRDANRRQAFAELLIAPSPFSLPSSSDLCLRGVLTPEGWSSADAEDPAPPAPRNEAESREADVAITVGGQTNFAIRKSAR